MATILPFLVQQRDSRQKNHRVQQADRAATIIIFPGVRYERLQDGDVKASPRIAAASRHLQECDR